MTSVLPLDNQLCFSLYATSMAINRAYKPMLDELGITYPQYLVLHALWEADGRTVGAIAKRLSLESSTVTPPIQRLEAAELVVRKRGVVDERQVEVWLTSEGLELRQQCGCLTAAILDRTGMTEAQLATLNQNVRALWQLLQ